MDAVIVVLAVLALSVVAGMGIQLGINIGKWLSADTTDPAGKGEGE